jgi:creatinine amidohydrolase
MVRRFADMTWEEAREVARAGAMAILPVGAVEAHGPHLPLGTDVVIAEAMAEAGAERLEVAGTPCVLLPALAYTAAPFAAAFPGTVTTDAAAVTTTITSIARSLTAHGFRALAIANSHLDPAHLTALRAAVDACHVERLLPVAFPDLTKKPWAARLGEEFRTGACHAGRYETSIVLAARPDLVREGVRHTLEANPASLSEAIRAGKATFEEAGGPQAFFGWPADASAEEGRRTIAVLGEILAEAVGGVEGAGASPRGRGA